MSEYELIYLLPGLARQRAAGRDVMGKLLGRAIAEREQWKSAWNGHQDRALVGWLEDYEGHIASALGKAAKRASGVTDDGFTPADAALVSVYSGLNAAYVAPEFEYEHDLLTLGAWVGQLVRGRSAYLSLLVAGRLADELDGMAGGGDVSGTTGIVRWHLALAGGPHRLLRPARRTIASGIPEELCGVLPVHLLAFARRIVQSSAPGIGCQFR